MNRLFLTASKSAAPSLRAARAAVRPPPLPARRFSDTADPPASPAPASASPDGDGDGDGGGTTRRRGVVKHFSFRDAYGFIVPDGVDRDDRSGVCFVHRNDIVVGDGCDAAGFLPGLARGQRVEFGVEPAPEGKASPRAVEVTLEGGKPAPPFRPGYLKQYVRGQKARFGDAVFEIFSTSRDQKELEEKIVAAFDEAKRNIDRQTERVGRAQALTGGDHAREEARLRDELGGETDGGPRE